MQCTQAQIGARDLAAKYSDGNSAAVAVSMGASKPFITSPH